MEFTIFADGGSRGNPGPAGAGAIVRDGEGKVVAEISEYLGINTNNVAEYTGILSALETLAAKLGEKASEASIIVKMDSMLVVKQMNGEYRIKHPNLQPLAARVNEVRRKFKSVTFAHVYREHNKEADRLANLAMDKGMKLAQK
jgi:ribonuclease HI